MQFTVTAVKTGTYAAAYWETVRVDPSSGGFTVTLPTAVGQAGRQIRFKNVTAATNAVTLDGNGAETIDGTPTYDMTIAFQSITIESDGANWMVV